MKSFKKTKLEPAKRVCLAIKQARLNTGVSLDELAKRTKINKEYLQALEECRFADLDCAHIYQKNFIKKYVEALGLDASVYLKQFSDEELRFASSTKQHGVPNCNKRYFSNLPQMLRYAVVAAIILVVSLYLGGQIKHTLEPPSLTLLTPSDGQIIYESGVIIRGYTEPEVKILINGETIVSDEYGNFSENVTLNPGINAVTIRAEKKHGKATEEIRHIIFKQTKSLTGAPADQS